jgi:hypothetical protein
MTQDLLRAAKRMVAATIKDGALTELNMPPDLDDEGRQQFASAFEDLSGAIDRAERRVPRSDPIPDVHPQHLMVDP